MSQLQVKVINKTVEAEDIASFELAGVDGKSLPPFSAGSHIDVHIRDGLIRQYSLCNPPHESHRYQIGVLRDANSRGGSVAMHGDIKVGDVLTISEPRNHFPLTQAKRTLLLAGGIGVTPILCMAERLAATGADFAMHYCARSPERTAFRDRIAESGFADRVVYHYDKGWPSSQVHLEYFGAAPVETDGDAPFDVKIASSGQVFTIPAGETVIKILADNGVDIPVSCEQGVCGTCLTRVLDGVPDHRDLYLTDEERAANDQFTPCCSRAKSTLLVLDV